MFKYVLWFCPIEVGRVEYLIGELDFPSPQRDGDMIDLGQHWTVIAQSREQATLHQDSVVKAVSAPENVAVHQYWRVAGSQRTNFRALREPISILMLVPCRSEDFEPKSVRPTLEKK